MKLSSTILFVVLGLWLQFALIEANSEAASWSTGFVSKRHTEILPPTKNLTDAKRRMMLSLCGGAGRKCSHAEECCTLKCLKYYKSCTF